MKRIIASTVLSVALFCIFNFSTKAQNSCEPQAVYEPSPEVLEARAEFEGFKFGIFIHWGIYSMMGDGEWAMNVSNINYQEYARLAAGFCPSKFDAREWVRIFKDAGAKYMTFTSRHHDGFSMFDTDASEYNVVDATPFKRDVVGELAEACAEEGLSLHLYYSHLDWGRTDYWPLGKEGHGVGRPAGKEGDWEHYLAFVDQQLTELLTKYGKIGAIWFDGIWDKPCSSRAEQYGLWNLEHQYALIHRLQPSCMVGNNHHMLPFPGEDMEMFERDIPGHNDGGYSEGQGIADLPLETCQTMNTSWGYKIRDKWYKSSDELIRYLVKTAGKGANLLLNIGPRPDGTLPDEAIERLKVMGEWLRANGESIYGTKVGCVEEQGWGVTTQKDNVLYVHVLDWQPTIFLPLQGHKAVSANLFCNGAKVSFTQTREGIILILPQKAEGQVDQIVKMSFKEL
jgi:Alpha-L-fucosidase